MAEGYAQISDCYVVYLLFYRLYRVNTVTCSIAGHPLGALMYLKTRYLQIAHLRIFFHCFKKFKCLGDVLASVSLPEFAKLQYCAIETCRGEGRENEMKGKGNSRFLVNSLFTFFLHTIGLMLRDNIHL